MWEFCYVSSCTFSKDRFVTFLWILLFRLAIKERVVFQNSVVSILVHSTRTFLLHLYVFLFSYILQRHFCYICMNSSLLTNYSWYLKISLCIFLCFRQGHFCYISVDSTLPTVYSRACDIWEFPCVCSRTFSKELSVTFLWILLYRLTIQERGILKNCTVSILVLSTRTFLLHFYGFYSTN